MTKHSHFVGIDLKFRPESYFWAQDKGIALISDIKGAERRKIYATHLEAGTADGLIEQYSQHTLSESDRRSFGQIHPSCMGGEYLPNTSTQEVEIARITIASTTQDVTCVYAKRIGQRIKYRIVDEYEGGTISGKATRTSIRPLSLKELLQFFLKGWRLIECLDFNFADQGHPRDEAHAFIVDASSSFYADFGEAVSAEVDTWLDSLELEKT